jgi:hypothetical protein
LKAVLLKAGAVERRLAGDRESGGWLAMKGCAWNQGAAQVLPLVIICISSVKTRKYRLNPI